jgi:hypothetical protein
MSAYFEIKFRKPHEVHAIKLFPTKMTQVEQFFMIATEAETGRKTPIREKIGMATKVSLQRIHKTVLLLLLRDRNYSLMDQQIQKLVRFC